MMDQIVLASGAKHSSLLTHLRVPAARCARVMPNSFASEIRGRRESGVPAAPAASRVEKNTRVRPQVHRDTRPSLRNGFNGFLRALLGDRALLSPSPPRSFASRELNASVGASGPHDFAVRISTVRPRPVFCAALLS